MTFTGDELILALLSLVRATHPGMLRQEAGGFTLDTAALANRESLSDDERLLLKLYAALEAPSEREAVTLELGAGEARRLASRLERLESLQPWPADVLAMSAALRARLAALP